MNTLPELDSIDAEFHARFDEIMSPAIARKREFDGKTFNILREHVELGNPEDAISAIPKILIAEGVAITQQAYTTLTTELLKEASFPTTINELEALTPIIAFVKPLTPIIAFVKPLAPAFEAKNHLWQSLVLPLYEKLDGLLASVDTIKVSPSNTIALALAHVLRVPVYRYTETKTGAQQESLLHGIAALLLFGRSFDNASVEVRLALDCLGKEIQLRRIWERHTIDKYLAEQAIDVAQTSIGFVREVNQTVIDGTHFGIKGHIAAARSKQAKGAVGKRHMPMREAKEYVQSEWAQHGQTGYAGNKSDFAATYSKLVTNKFGVNVRERTIREDWLK